MLNHFYSCFLTRPCTFFALEVELRFGRGICPCRLYLMSFLRKSAWRWVIYRPANSLFAHAWKSCWAPSAKPFSWKLHVQWGCSRSPKLCMPFPMSSQVGCAASALASFPPCSFWQVRLFRLWLRVGRLSRFSCRCLSNLKEEGKATWYVCRYGREEKTSGPGKGEVKLHVSEQGMEKAALSTLSLPSISFVGYYYLHF